LVRNHTRRVLNRRKPAEQGETTEPEGGDAAADAADTPVRVSAPAPGAKPVRPRRPSGKRGARER